MFTVCAVSTPRGKGGVAVVRLSGDTAFAVALAAFKPRFSVIDPDNVDQKFVRHAIFGDILSADNEKIDEGILTLYKAPHSFTGENVAEIACHGGVAVTEETYLSCIAHGASAAGRGEFTKRAFLNGKLSLTEAEAVGQLIDADTGDKVRLAVGALSGSVSREIQKISDSLTDVMTALYAAIDYPEEDVGDEGERNIMSAVGNALANTEKLLSTYKTGRAISEGVKTCICGKPNVGKSSLFNLIVGDDSAIVTDIPGTTRDILRENVSFGGITLRLSDTAGMRDADDVVEKFGVERAEREMNSAELVFALFDGTRPLDDDDRHIIALAKNLQTIPVMNKCDGELIPDVEEELVREFGGIIRLSAKLGEGKEALSAAVAEKFGRGELDLSRDAIIWDSRQREILLHSRDSLKKAYDGLECGDPLDCICTLVEESMAYLSETDGRMVGENIVDEVFKRFCVGK